MASNDLRLARRESFGLFSRNIRGRAEFIVVGGMHPFRRLLIRWSTLARHAPTWRAISFGSLLLTRALKNNPPQRLYEVFGVSVMAEAPLPTHNEG